MKGTYKPPILGSFEDIGKDIAREVVKAPADIGQKIVESLTGTTSQKGQQGQKPQQQKPEGPLGELDETNDQQVKKSIARAALQQLATPGRPVEPSYEQKKQEVEQRKIMEQKQKEKSASQELPRMSSKKRRGDLYGVKGKSSTEMSKNVRQD